MGPGKICILVLCIFLYCQVQAKAKKCRRTNKKPFRYCLARKCTKDSNCRANERCLCDGDCGLSCVRNGTDCGRPESHKGLRVRLSGGTKFGSIASFSCRGDQYTLRGSRKRVCRGIGKWDGKAAKCRILCKHPGDIAYGNNNGDKKNYRVGSTISYWCFPGYDMEGKSAISCNNKGKWSTAPPKCTAPTCSKPTPPDNAFIFSRRKLKEKYKFNEVVRFRCEYGYYASGSSFRRCLASGWSASNSNFRCIPKSCGDPGSPINGKREGYVFTFKKKVHFKCNRGYMRVGPEYRQCQSNQKWSDKTPTCEPIDCGRLPAPQHGEKIEETSTTFEGKVAFQCKKIGYELIGTAERICQENGKWSGSRTTCERVECKDPGPPRNGERKPDKDKYVYEDRINFNCRTNFTLKGDRFVLCRETKDWTGTVPQCLAPCPDPGIPRGGHRFDHSFRHNNVVRFSCQRNWKMEGSQTIRCNNGRWDHKTPKCLEGCPRPNDRENMYRLSRKPLYFNGEEVRFNCHRGYKRVGYQRITCRNGKWSSDPPSCKRICSNPGKPYYGKISSFEFFEGKHIHFSCYSGYDLFGSKTIRCLPNGRWNASRPECKRRCYNLVIPSGGPTSTPPLVRGYRTKHGTNITFSCRSRYTLEGRQTIRCENGRWSNSNVPVCKAPCSDPGPLQYGQKYGSNFLHGNQVSYTCSGMYMLEGDTPLTCNNGRWDHPRPSCKEPCSSPGSPAKGNKFGSDYRHGKKVDYTCQRGTRLVGQSSLTCNDGQWSNTVPECLEICPVLGRPLYGRKIGKSESLSGDKVTFRCNSRFDLVGSAVLYCDQGQWNGSVPQCLGQCKVPDDYNVANVKTLPSVAARDWLHSANILTFSCFNKTMELDGKRSITCNDSTWSEDFPKCKVPCNTYSGSVDNGRKHETRFFVKYWCKKGYTLEGNSNITCVNGKWSSGPPKCLRGCYISQPDPQNKDTDTKTYYGHGQKYYSNCNQGFRLDGSPIITCNEGVWSHDIPTCIGVCPPLNAPENGERLDNNFDYNARVRFRCNPGYDIRGPSERICSGGKWSGKQPACRGRCPDPRIPLNGRRVGNNFTDGMTVEFFCDDGSQLEGDQFIKCSNGNWSGTTPTCSDCGSALGMENKKIPDSNIQASSTRWYRAKDGRLNGPRAWCSGSEREPYLQIDFGKPYRITGLATQGSVYGNKWVETYVLQSNLAGNSFSVYREDSTDKMFKGNTDSRTIVRRKIKNHLIARRIRINPVKFGGFYASPACMRVEVYGCDLPSDCIMTGSRIVAKWNSNLRGGYKYYKAYLTSISKRHLKVELEGESHVRPRYKNVLPYEDLPFVLDVPPKHEELQVGTRVLAPWTHTYYTSTINATRDIYNRYLVRADDGDRKFVTIDKIRLLKAPTFCNESISSLKNIM